MKDYFNQNSDNAGTIFAKYDTMYPYHRTESQWVSIYLSKCVKHDIKTVLKNNLSSNSIQILSLGQGNTWKQTGHDLAPPQYTGPM